MTPEILAELAEIYEEFCKYVEKNGYDINLDEMCAIENDAFNGHPDKDAPLTEGELEVFNLLFGGQKGGE